MEFPNFNLTFLVQVDLKGRFPLLAGRGRAAPDKPRVHSRAIRHSTKFAGNGEKFSVLTIIFETS